MLVALREGPDGRVEAGKDLTPGDFRCLECAWPVVLKRGRVKVPHFAHQPGSPACASGGESVTHMRAKTLLARRFRAQGYEVVLEEAHPAQQRRVDVAVTLIDRAGAARRIAVEIQDSAIAVDEMKRRTTADRHAGFFATLWVFTLSRLRHARSVLPATNCGCRRRFDI
ncbi:competence protein CoiA [Micromonospora aurantiaca (nom. illeg.)]|uniref:competence protein CoiA n=1 Tax=Micromonospora aurantiaca (nom. illeg.) TaxID=47850 RepID=UPI003DA64D93